MPTYRQALDANPAPQATIADTICHAPSRRLPSCRSRRSSPTPTGATSMRTARTRPAAPIFALTPDVAVARQLALLWGTYPIVTEPAKGVTQMVDMACATVAARGVAGAGDIIAIAAGMPFGVAGTTNLLRTERLPAGRLNATRPGNKKGGIDMEPQLQRLRDIIGGLVILPSARSSCCWAGPRVRQQLPDGAGLLSSVLSVLTMILGGVLTWKSLRGAPVEGAFSNIPWIGVASVIGSVVFGLTIRGIGLGPAVAVVVFVTASPAATRRWTSLLRLGGRDGDRLHAALRLRPRSAAADLRSVAVDRALVARRDRPRAVGGLRDGTAFEPGAGLRYRARSFNLLYCFIGVLLGTAVGVLPGLGPVATIAMLLPRPSPPELADHARRHLLRRAVRRLDHRDPDQPAR